MKGIPLPARFGRCLPRLRTPIPGPASRAWLQRLIAVECVNTTYHDSAGPVFWTQARGANVLDADGNCYIDLTAGFAVATLGHGHPAIVRAAAAQAAQLTQALGDVHPAPAKVALLEALAGAAPQPPALAGKPGRGRKIQWKTILALSGSEAVVAALKTACVATGRPGVLAFTGGYHGLTHGALLATARPLFRRPAAGQLAPVTRFADWPSLLDFHRAGRRERTPAAVCRASLAQVEQALRMRGAAAIGAVVVEPVQGRGGDRRPPPGFLRGLRRLCDRFGVALVFDEIYCGLGRTGRLFASQNEGVIADLYCLGKALGGGFPISACLGRSEFIDAWGPSQGEALHTSTFLGHPVGCAAGLASLRLLHAPAFLKQVRQRGALFWRQLRARLRNLPWVAEVRGEGWIGAVELVHDRQCLAPDTDRALRTVQTCLRRGLLLLPCGDDNHCLSITPPACLTAAQSRYAIETIGEALDAF